MTARFRAYRFATVQARSLVVGSGAPGPASPANATQLAAIDLPELDA